MLQYDKELFFQAIYEIVKHIPSYAAIAKAIGYPNLSRMVGRAMNRCNVDIPAHRVVNNQGILTGRTAWEDCRKMQQLLESEGIRVENHRIKDWGKIFWNPLTEL